MLYSPARRQSSLDQALIWTAAILGAFGLVMVYSASVAMADAERFTGYRPSYFLVRHGAYIAVGMVAALALFRVPLWLWQKASPWLFMFGTGLLVIVLIPGIGRVVFGARRWISLVVCGFLNWYLMKFFVVVFSGL
jgi:cell division protein FtsW